MSDKKKGILFAILFTGFVLYFVVSAFGRVSEIFDSLRVPGRVERVFFEVFQIGLGTGFLICLYLVTVAVLFLYVKGYLDQLFKN
jgi:hypothetical protein